MKIYLDREKQSLVTRSYLLLDSNVVSFIFKSPEHFEEFQSLFPSQHFLIDPYVALEFVRDTFIPDLYHRKVEFIENPDYFHPLPLHPDIFNNLKENVVLLSRIYAHQLESKGRKSFPPLTDLFLAARLMSISNSYFVTSDFEDFPLFLFNRINLITFEENDDKRTQFQILEFSRENYGRCMESLNQIRLRRQG